MSWANAGDTEDPADGDPPAGPAPGLSVSVRLETPDTDPPLDGWLDTELVRLARLAGLDSGRLAVTVVDDARMVRLHERYRQAPHTTDVLTFDLSDAPGGPVEGDVVVCLDEAARQASVRNHTVRIEILLYALHGLLHLLGYDDQHPQDASRMHRREDEILSAAGFGKVYAACES